MSLIHPTAIIAPSAELDSSVSVGAYTTIGPHVKVAAGTVIAENSVFSGHTTIGRDNRFFPFCTIGAEPQDKKYRGEPTLLEIGDRNTIREFCSFHVGTVQDGGVTRLGDDNWIMSYVHLAHDCHVGNNTIFANSTQLAGHVKVHDYAILAGFTMVHQFVQIGAHSMTAINTVLLQDLPPYVTAAGNTAKAVGINVEGLKRRGFTAEQIATLRTAYKTLYRQGHTLAEVKAIFAQQIEQDADSAAVLPIMLDFLTAATRGIVR